MLSNQKDLFELNPESIFLNCAYMSPQLKTMTAIGIDQLVKKQTPDMYGVGDFFEPRENLKAAFAKLIEAPNSKGIAIIPSVSYGMASVARNIELYENEEILVVESQFPSHIYAWQNLADTNGGKLRVIDAPILKEGRAKVWNASILSAINERTKVVAIPQVHWADGTLYDLETIREKSNQVGAKLIIDGTQSVGAMPFSIEKIQPDALICAGYKWLMGPYGMGVAYFAESFWDGLPIEFNWMNRFNSQDFKNLTNYQPAYKEGAEKYSAGGSSNFIHTHMLTEGLRQVMEWGPENIQEYCKDLVDEGITRLRERGCFVEGEGGRGNHLFGIYIHEGMNYEAIRSRLQEAKINVSFRGNAIRVSPHLYNEKEDFDRFVGCVVS